MVTQLIDVQHVTLTCKAEFKQMQTGQYLYSNSTKLSSSQRRVLWHSDMLWWPYEGGWSTEACPSLSSSAGRMHSSAVYGVRVVLSHHKLRCRALCVHTWHSPPHHHAALLSKVCLGPISSPYLHPHAKISLPVQSIVAPLSWCTALLSGVAITTQTLHQCSLPPEPLLTMTYSLLYQGQATYTRGKSTQSANRAIRVIPPTYILYLMLSWHPAILSWMEDHSASTCLIH